MKAYVTSIGEPTTDLCVWSLERNGFAVYLLDAPHASLAEKLKWIYEDRPGENFIRVDADVIVNRYITPQFIEVYVDNDDTWWTQFITYDWYKQDTTYGGIQFIKKEALPALRNNIDKFINAERPESQMYRLDEFDNPRRCVTFEGRIMGLNGYAQTDLDRVIETKRRRKQLDNYDFELVERLNKL